MIELQGFFFQPSEINFIKAGEVRAIKGYIRHCTTVSIASQTFTLQFKEAPDSPRCAEMLMKLKVLDTGPQSWKNRYYEVVEELKELCKGGNVS